ncbi:MAG: hypothetical protein PHR47_00210 [Candidatus Pacebacteria bacterium]|nr:hypothetical protein [Candidatus Paceibacterota bacterium]
MKNNLNILFLVIVLVILGIVGFYFLPKGENLHSDKVILNQNQEKVSDKNEQTKNETDSWKVFEDKNAGFLIKYPTDVALVETGENQTEGNNLYKLSVESKKIDLLDGTMGFNKETALKNLEFLKNGNYGENVDWPFEASKSVTKIDTVNAQEFVVFSRFEVCNVTFERKLYFFNNNYQIVVTLTGPKKEIMTSMPDYFKTDKDNCGEEKIWNFEKQGQFLENLKKNTGSDVALRWFNVFNQIKGTIKFTGSAVTGSDLLSGRWISLDDEKSEIEFSGKKMIDYYQGQKVSEGSFTVNGEYLTVTSDGDEYKYSIVEVSNDSLVLTYLSRGNTLKYKRATSK